MQEGESRKNKSIMFVVDQASIASQKGKGKLGTLIGKQKFRWEENMQMENVLQVI